MLKLQANTINMLLYNLLLTLSVS